MKRVANFKRGSEITGGFRKKIPVARVFGPKKKNDQLTAGGIYEIRIG